MPSEQNYLRCQQNMMQELKAKIGQVCFILKIPRRKNSTEYNLSFDMIGMDGFHNSK